MTQAAHAAPVSQRGVLPLHRALGVLETLAELGPLELTRLASATNIPTPSTLRVLKALIGRGYVLRHADHTYSVAPTAIRLVGAAERSISTAAGPVLAELARTTGETASLAALQNDSVVHLASADSPHALRTTVDLGQQNHAHCTAAGKLLLAQLPEQQGRRLIHRRHLPRCTSRTITDPDTLIGQLAMIRTSGVAVEDGEHELARRGVAVPVHAPRVAPLALCVSGPDFRLTVPPCPNLLAHMRDAVRALEEELQPPREDRPCP